MANENETNDGPDRLDASRRTFVKTVGTLTAATVGATGFGNAQEDSSTDIDALVDQMTLEQKALRTHGGDVEDAPEGIAGSVADVGELDVPQLNMADGPPGASIGRPSTDFPHPITAASTFDPSLVSRQGAAIAREAKGWGVDVLLGPSMDTFRVPFHSRSGESYGEDPHLASQMAAAYTGAVQNEGVIATLKHYVAYNQTRTTGDVEDGFSTSEHNVIVDERALREIYLRPFKAAVQDGRAGAVMPAYNRVNGTFCSEHYELLREILKDDWGFDGFVVSDWGGTHSTVGAAVNGLDIEMPSAEYFGTELEAAVAGDDLSEDVVDEMVRRGLRSQRETGALTGDREGVGDESAIGTGDHFDLARRMAEEGSVLLKNEGALPLSDSNIGSVALIGPSPSDFKQDVGGSDSIDAIRRISPEQGLDEVTDDSVTVDTVATDNLELVAADGDGFAYEYYDNRSLNGDPVETGTGESIDVSSPPPGEEGPFSSARWEGTVTPSEDGAYGLAFTSGGQGYLYIDGERVGYNEPAGFFAVPERSGIELEAGTTYDVTVEIFGEAPARLQWNPPASIRAARDAAANNDVAIVLAETYTNYGDDRYQFPLPADQNAVIESVAEVNDDVVVLLNTESPVGMPWVDDVPAVMQVWYPGQEAGTAVADLLFGNANPSGKSPVTFARSAEDYLPTEVNTLPDEGRGYPGVSGNVYYDEGVFVGYRHFDRRGIEPLFPFGHGESYTDFEYSKVTVTPRSTTPDDGVSVEVDVTNAGDRNGAEAVQVYVGEVDPVVERPPKELKGIAKVEIAAGETETVEIDLGCDAFQYWDPDEEDWLVDCGEYRVLVGASSRDIREETTVRVRSSGRGPDQGRGRDSNCQGRDDGPGDGQ